jgi:UDP-N-acetylmuramate dehydrogenase
MTKIPAARLIEHAELKGIRHDAIGTFPLQPLVIVNYGGGTGEQIETFANFIRHHIQKKFGIILEPEAQFWR